MKKADIRVGAVYTNGKGKCRHVVDEGPHLAPRQIEDTDCVCYVEVDVAGTPRGEYRSCTRAAFAAWAKADVPDTTPPPDDPAPADMHESMAEALDAHFAEARAREKKARDGAALAAALVVAAAGGVSVFTRPAGPFSGVAGDGRPVRDTLARVTEEIRPLATATREQVRAAKVRGAMAAAERHHENTKDAFKAAVRHLENERRAQAERGRR